MLLRRRIDIPTTLLDSTVASTVSTAELETVLRLGTRVTVPGGTIIMDEAGFGREFLVVLDGSLAVSREGDEVATLGAGDIVGVTNRTHMRSVSLLHESTKLRNRSSDITTRLRC